MGRRGPIPGAAAKRRAVEQSIRQPPAGGNAPARCPACPGWLPEAARGKWAELGPGLARRGILTPATADCFVVYVVAWAEFRLSAEALEKDGRVVKSLTGGPRSHPAAAQLASAAKTLQQVGSLFGLNPAAAARMVATQAPGEGDALDLFLSGADTPPLKLADIVADLAGEEE